jgi:aminoglycoside phosphotransferase (APT) family kinase protein
MPPELGDRDTIISLLRRMWAEDDLSSEICLDHGEIHLGQTYIETDGKVGILDWQGCALMPWAKDVAYFLGAALPTEERRIHQESLLEHYRCELSRCGGPVLERSATWRDYRKQMLGGIMGRSLP